MGLIIEISPLILVKSLQRKSQWLANVQRKTKQISGASNVQRKKQKQSGASNVQRKKNKQTLALLTCIEKNVAATNPQKEKQNPQNRA